MPLIKNSCIEDIKSRVNIYDLASSYVALKKSGSAYKGLSPFTTEKTPSFFVYPDKNFFYCFSTSQGGDIFKLVQIKENMSFPEAAEFIANRFNVPIEYDESAAGARQNTSLKKQLYDIHEDTAAWFSKCFWAETQDGEAMRRYWTEERRFSLEDAKTLRIGFAPLDDAPLKKGLEKRGYAADALKQSGLFFAREFDFDFRNFKPRFRGRLMIPICDFQGRVIAFTARKTALTPTDMAYEEGKYVNSPETEIFKKNAVLFNLNNARKKASETGEIIIVEGQLDAARMFCSGFENCVASQGTALGLEQLSLAKRYASTAVLLFDGDSAGVKAALRVIPLCVKSGLAPYIVPLPKGSDPDSLIKNGGAGAMESLLKNSRQNPMSFAMGVKLKENPNPSPMQKSALIEELFETVDACASSVAAEDYLRAISNAATADLGSVKRDFQSWKRRNKSATPAYQEANSPFLADTGRAMLTNAAHDALVLCLNYEKIAKALAHNVDESWLDSDNIDERALFAVLGLHKSDIGFDISELDIHIEDERVRQRIYEAYTKGKDAIENPVWAANKCIETLHKKYCMKKIDILNQKLAQPELSLSDKLEVLGELKRLRQSAKTAPCIIEGDV